MADYLRVEEDLRAEEAFVANVDVEGVLADRVDAVVLLDPFCWVRVVLGELLHNVWANVAVALL